MWLMLKISAICALIRAADGSVGDSTRQYRTCLYGCKAANCSEDGSTFRTDYQQLAHLKLLGWSCFEECKYECMWKTVEIFQKNNLKIPQFHGKWPFKRFLGIQEPASMVFSLLNLFMHAIMLKQFREKVRPGSPLRWLWFLYGAVCSHAWFWSAVFHTRDFPLTEFLDYVCAFSILLANCYVMCVRVFPHVFIRFFQNQAQVVAVLSVVFLLFFLKHAAYLSTGRFDYGYNIVLNIQVGAFTAIGWLLWSLKYRTKPPYIHNCRLYVVLSCLVLVLEVFDQPPLFFVFDHHAFWHLATAPLLYFIYRFAIDDCRYLRNMEGKGLLGDENGGKKNTKSKLV